MKEKIKKSFVKVFKVIFLDQDGLEIEVKDVYAFDLDDAKSRAELYLAETSWNCLKSFEIDEYEPAWLIAPRIYTHGLPPFVVTGEWSSDEIISIIQKVYPQKNERDFSIEFVHPDRLIRMNRVFRIEDLEEELSYALC